MNRLIIVAGILYLSTSYSLKIRSFDEVGECHYWNDPHLKPFPKAAGENGEQFLCRPNCTEVLLRNEFVEIFVTSNQNGREYPIVEYTVIFFPTDDHPVPCVIRDSIANQSPASSLKCPLNSPATSIGTYIHESDNVRVEIGYRGDWFNFYITQSFELIGKSSGVCVNSKCDLEGSGRRRTQAQDKEPNRLISQIIDIYTEAVRRHVDGKIDDHLLESQRIAIVYDLNTSLNPRYARVIVPAILRENIKKDENLENFSEHLLKIGEVEKAIVAEADQEVNKLIESSERFCKGDKDEQRCLERINDGDKEHAKRRR